MDYFLRVPVGREIDYWIDFASSSLEHAKERFDRCIVDFQSNKFLETDDLVILASVIEYFHIYGSEISFINDSGKLYSYLKTIKFINFWESDYNRNNFLIPYRSSTVTLWKINPEHTFSYKERLQDFLKKRFLNDKIDLTSLGSNVEEVFNNIFDHSESKVNGFILGQYFPNKKRFSFSVCDLGVGIPFRVNKYNLANNLHEIKDEHAVYSALEIGFTTKSTERNRGFGLNNLLEMTESSNGELRVISNKGCVIKEADEPFFLHNFGNNFLHGTLIRVDIDVNTFDEIDLSDEIMNFNF